MYTLWIQIHSERKTSETHKISTWRSKVFMLTMQFHIHSEGKPSDTHEVCPWRPTVFMHTLWIHFHAEKKSSETHKISPPFMIDERVVIKSEIIDFQGLFYCIRTFCRLIMLMLRKTLLPSLDTGLWLSCRDWILSGRGNTGREVREELCNVENSVRNRIQFSFPKSLLVYADCTVLVFMLNSYNIFNTQQ